MRITIRELREIIRESLRHGGLREMALAADPTFHDHTKQTRPGSKELDKSVERFANTPLFKKKAVKTFEGFPQKVYLITAHVPTQAQKSKSWRAEGSLSAEMFTKSWQKHDLESYLHDKRNLDRLGQEDMPGDDDDTRETREIAKSMIDIVKSKYKEIEDVKQYLENEVEGFEKVGRYSAVSGVRGVDILWNTKPAPAISPELYAELKAAVAGGATVFVNMADNMTHGSWPTPWMMLHAIMDNPDGDYLYAGQIFGESKVESLVSAREAICARLAAVSGARKGPRMAGFKGSKRPIDLVDFMTMGSARSIRSGKIKPNTMLCNDAEGMNETLVQAITDSRGFRLDLSEQNPAVMALPEKSRAEILGMLESYQELVNSLGLREAFHDYVKGKVLFVQTDVGADT